MAQWPTLPVDDVPERVRTDLRAVHTDRRGQVWFGAGDGQLGVRGSQRRRPRASTVDGGAARGSQDHDGVLWAGGDDGMSRMDGGEWSASRGCRASRQRQEHRRGQCGDLWVGIGTGIIRLAKAEFLGPRTQRDNPASLSLLQRRRRRGRHSDCRRTCTGVRAADGRMWSVTSGGLTIVDADRVGEPPVMPPVRIESVTADAQKFDPQSRLFAPSRTSHLHIAFTALTLDDPTRIRFRYRLDGFDHD